MNALDQSILAAYRERGQVKALRCITHSDSSEGMNFDVAAALRQNEMQIF